MLNPLAPLRPYLAGAALTVFAGMALAIAGQAWWIHHQAQRIDALEESGQRWARAVDDYKRAITTWRTRFATYQQGEAAGLTASNKFCATDINSAYQKGVAAGRAIEHAQPVPEPGPGGQPAPVGVPVDFRSDWARDAYRPAG